MSLKNWCSIHARCPQSSLKHSIRFSGFFFSSLKQNFIAYRSSKVSSRPDCIFEIQQLWLSGFSRVYSNCCCNCSFKPAIIKTGQSYHKMYSNNILNFQDSTTILNTCTKKKSGNLLNEPCILVDTGGNDLLQLAPIATLKSCDTTKQSVCGWLYIYIYIYSTSKFYIGSAEKFIG